MAKKERYKMEYVNCEVGTITDTYENEELTAEQITDLLNKHDGRIKELEESIQKISEKTKEFKKHIESEIQFADNNIEKDERWKIHKNCYEQVLEEMPMLLLWEGDVE